MNTEPSVLIAIPAHNEERYIDRVLPRVLEYGLPVLVIDDGSTDCTAARVAKWPVELVRNPVNAGYGRVMRDILAWSSMREFDWVITMDCDDQHEPAFIALFLEHIRRNDVDIVSGSRYLKSLAGDTVAPADRSEINRTLTIEINHELKGAFDGGITDAFCGFKAYRAVACSALPLDADRYDFPMQFWVQAAANRLRVREIAVPRIYLDSTRTFGNGLDDPIQRLLVYRATFRRELERCKGRLSHLRRPPCVRS